MDIEITRMGAIVDVTDEVLPDAVELLADAFAENESVVGSLLASLAEARSALRARKADAAAGRNISDERIEQAACEVDGIRDALVALLDGSERVTIPLTAAGCRRDGEVLLSAAQAAEGRFRTAGQTATVKALLPHQRGLEDAA